MSNRLASAGSGSGMSAVTPPGMRAVSIRVDDVVAVARFVGPGSRVGVLLTRIPSGSGQPTEVLTKSIMENVQMLAAGQKMQPDAHGTPEKVNVVTLLCNIKDASKLTLASSEGRIQLVLRNPTDMLKNESAREWDAARFTASLSPHPSKSLCENLNPATTTCARSASSPCRRSAGGDLRHH